MDGASAGSGELSGPRLGAFVGAESSEAVAAAESADSEAVRRLTVRRRVVVRDPDVREVDLEADARSRVGLRPLPLSVVAVSSATSGSTAETLLALALLLELRVVRVRRVVGADVALRRRSDHNPVK